MSGQLQGDDLVKYNISETLLRLTDNDDVARLAVIGIGRVLFRHHKKDGNWGDVFDAYLVEIRHIIDWLASSLVDGDEWLKRVDAEDRPLKLMKMHSIDQLKAEADKAFAKKMQKIETKITLPGDERLHMKLADGFSVVRLLTPGALDRESTAMQHCVGLGGYDHHLADDRRGLFSLRDSFNKPHATIELDMVSKQLIQLSGKQNRLPISKYLQLLAPFIAAEAVNCPETISMGFVIGKDAIVHHASDIPDGAEFEGTLSLQGYDGDDGDIRIPCGIKVDGDLVLDQTFTEILSKPGTVSGHIHARGLDLPDISPDFVFGGLYCDGSWLGNLPDNLHIRGNLVLKQCRKVVLPRGLVIDGDLDLTQADVHEIPDDIVVKGSLMVANTALTHLPAGLSIGGGLFVGGTKQLEEVPAGFSVGGNLMLRDSSVRYIAEGVTVGGMVSVHADAAGELEVAASAEIDGGFYFRPTATVRSFEGRMSMTTDEFKAATSRVATPQRKIAGLG
ncbi:PcfJ domain-containing protein [Rhizobium sp. BK176]|uniref:PcfJ domain-containing protein n=1 Tax=Rhizobium sp. BK176 TaxID=2587071 RepID=UPI00216A24D0|nr:PcfJ domain-containing protein [Rhizobium sp. BK176]MCS4089731.1 hypothetical protein [Rhizobium sp. BK176]